VRVTNTGGKADSNTATITVVPAPLPCSTPFHPDSQRARNRRDQSPCRAKHDGSWSRCRVIYEGPSPALRGFYLQDQTPDSDPATSEGVFVFEANNANLVSVGDVVQVAGWLSKNSKARPKINAGQRSRTAA
jgi:hypothetical protein